MQVLSYSINLNIRGNPIILKSRNFILQSIVVVLWIVAIILPTACSNKKNTFSRRVYHNLTAHYNTWWNGNESLKDAVKDLEKNANDNYTEVLPVFKLGSKKEIAAINAKADRAIEKASKVIQNNSMYFNKKEYNRWIDDSYMMIGKAYFYKQDYASARRTFEFILSRYKDSPLIPEVYIWLGLTNNQMEQYSRSEAELEKFRMLSAKKTMPRSMMLFYNKVLADFYLKQNKTNEAIKTLHVATNLSRKKSDKTRLHFILGQLYLQNNDLANASQMFQEVIKRTPPYNMQFAAQLNLARCYDVNSGEADNIEKMLRNMLKEEKNKPYQDQVYYALAEVDLKKGNRAQAIENLRLSVATSKDNDFQRVQSSLILANLYFEKPDYFLSQAYYDTALQALPKEHPHYDSLQNKSQVLTELVNNLIIVQTEDSLQRLALMPEAERMKVIDGIIAQYAEEEKKKQEEEMLRQSDLATLGQNRIEQQMNPSGAWYFYNPSAISLGFTEFRRKWGNRKLEDLWRLSNKQVIAVWEEEQTLASSDSITSDSLIAKISNDPLKRETYLQNLPLTPEKLQQSNQNIIEALFNAAFIYREGLFDLVNAEKTFEQLVERYPDTSMNKHYLLSCYQLVVLNEKLGNKEKADYYRNILTSNFPTTDYARILGDPAYVQEMERKNKSVDEFYTNTYRAYQSGQYYLVVMNCDDAVNRFPNHPLLPKFEFLRAISIGKIDVADSLAINLQRFILHYPKHELVSLARDILDQLSKLDPSVSSRIQIPGDTISTSSGSETPKVTYVIEPQSDHFVLIMANPFQTDINALKIRIADFNERAFRLENFYISDILLNDTLQIISIGVFKNASKALDYYHQIIDNEYVFSMLKGKFYEVYAISTKNYQLFYQDRDISQYKVFFEKEYLKKN